MKTILDESDEHDGVKLKVSLETLVWWGRCCESGQGYGLCLICVFNYLFFIDDLHKDKISRHIVSVLNCSEFILIALILLS